MRKQSTSSTSFELFFIVPLAFLLLVLLAFYAAGRQSGEKVINVQTDTSAVAQPAVEDSPAQLVEVPNEVVPLRVEPVPPKDFKHFFVTFKVSTTTKLSTKEIKAKVESLCGTVRMSSSIKDIRSIRLRGIYTKDCNVYIHTLYEECN